MRAKKSTEASLESHVKIPRPSCVERREVWRSEAGALQGPRAVGYGVNCSVSGPGGLLKQTLQHSVGEKNSIPRLSATERFCSVINSDTASRVSQR